MGLGDEIMALGRAEALYEATGKKVAICRFGGYPRQHEAWDNHPAIDQNSSLKIIDGGGARPYIKEWLGRQAIYNMDYRARAGKIHLTQDEIDFFKPKEKYAVVAPFLKENASPNKDWGFENWEKVIKDFPIKVYQLLENENHKTIKGAIGLHTKHFRLAASVISRSSIVLCNEGGTHHMAASFKIPAVVIFGSFVPPKVTGYDFHENISVQTDHGFCGKFDLCNECQKNLKSINPDFVRQKAEAILNG